MTFLPAAIRGFTEKREVVSPPERLPEPRQWARLSEPGALVRAWERVFAARRPATRIAPEGITRADLYRDVSTYCGLGPSRPDGSVVRAAASPVVNILGGGGLAPVVPEDVVRALA